LTERDEPLVGAIRRVCRRRAQNPYVVDQRAVAIGEWCQARKAERRGCAGRGERERDRLPGERLNFRVILHASDDIDRARRAQECAESAEDLAGFKEFPGDIVARERSGQIVVRRVYRKRQSSAASRPEKFSLDGRCLTSATRSLSIALMPVSRGVGAGPAGCYPKKPAL
jgi:hypothetical protein